jgi:ATP-binding protein involved in chromosome partitioning
LFTISNIPISVTTDEIKEHLKQVKYPGFSRDIVSFGLVRSAGLLDGVVKVSLALTTSDPKVPLHLKTEVEKCLRVIPGVKEILVEVSVAPAKAPTAAGAVHAHEVGVAEGADRRGAVLFTARPQIATGKATKHGRAASLCSFTLQGIENFFDAVHQRRSRL